MGKKEEKISSLLVVFCLISFMVGLITMFCIYTVFYPREEWVYIDWSGFTTVNNTALIEELMTREPYRNPYRGYAKVLEGDVVIVYPFLTEGQEFFEVITTGGYVVE